MAALVALFAGAAAFGLSPTIIRVSEVGPAATGFWRLILALPVVWLWMRYEARRPSPPAQPASRTDLIHLILLSLLLGLTMTAWQVSVATTSIINAQLISHGHPIFVTLGAFILFKERITLLFLTGMLISLAGMVALVTEGPADLGPMATGDLLAAMAAVLIAIYLLGVKRLRLRFSTATVVTWNTAIAAPVLLAAALLLGEEVIPASWFGWLIVLIYALIVQAAGNSLFIYAFAALPASFNAVGLLSTDVLAVGLAWLLISEPLSSLQLAFGAIVLAGIALSQRGTR